MLFSIFNFGNHLLIERCFIPGLPFCVYIRVSEKMEAGKTVQHLGVFLNCMNGCDFSNWSIDTKFDLNVYSHATGKFVKFSTFNCKFGLKTMTSIGKDEFISYETLMRPSFGYVKNDTVRLLVEMSADSVVRIDQELSKVALC